MIFIFMILIVVWLNEEKVCTFQSSKCLIKMPLFLINLTVILLYPCVVLLQWQIIVINSNLFFLHVLLFFVCIIWKCRHINKPETNQEPASLCPHFLKCCVTELYSWRNPILREINLLHLEHQFDIQFVSVDKSQVHTSLVLIEGLCSDSFVLFCFLLFICLFVCCCCCF